MNSTATIRSHKRKRTSPKETSTPSANWHRTHTTVNWSRICSTLRDSWRMKSSICWRRFQWTFTTISIRCLKTTSGRIMPNVLTKSEHGSGIRAIPAAAARSSSSTSGWWAMPVIQKMLWRRLNVTRGKAWLTADVSSTRWNQMETATTSSTSRKLHDAFPLKTNLLKTAFGQLFLRVTVKCRAVHQSWLKSCSQPQCCIVKYI